MKYLKIIQKLNNSSISEFIPIFLSKDRFGYLLKKNIELLQDFSFPLEIKNNVAIWNAPHHFQERNAQLNELCLALKKANILLGWRGELLPIYNETHETLAHIERSAASLFSIRAFGVHLNAFCGDKLWFAQRSGTKSVEPLKFDQIAAGGIAVGFDALATLEKEAYEEADIKPELIKKACPVGIVSYAQKTELGMRRDTLFNFDLEVNSSFSPQNNDGEVARFFTAHLEELPDLSDNFKQNSLLVLVDFLIRHGKIKPTHSDYIKLCQLLMHHLWDF